MIFLLPAFIQMCASGQAVEQIQKFPTTLAAYKQKIGSGLERTFVGEVKGSSYIEPHIPLNVQKCVGVGSVLTAICGIGGFMYAAHKDSLKGVKIGLVATGVGFGGFVGSVWLHVKQHDMRKKIRISEENTKQ